MDGRTKKFDIKMLDDLNEMGDKDFCSKWNCSRQMPIRLRKKYNIESFNNQHGTKEHKFINGIEYKYCSKRHWKPISEFNRCPSRYDGLRCYCKTHSRKEGLQQYHSNNGKEKCRAWTKTDIGKNSLRNTWRKQKAIKDNAYVQWDIEDEDRAYNLFDGRCAYCGKKVKFERVEFDHFVPIASGGKTEPRNMLPCCWQCNHGKGGKFTKDGKEWLIEKFGADRGNIVYKDILDKLVF